MTALIVAITAVLGAVALTAWHFRSRGFYEGMRAAGQRDRDQAKIDFVRGKADGVRQASLWLRGHGFEQAANQMTNLQIEP